MSRRFLFLRSLACMTLALFVLSARAAQAQFTQIETTHADPAHGFLGPVDATDRSWVASWTQTETLADVEFRLTMLQRSVENETAIWTLATDIGPDADASDVIATGVIGHTRPLPAVVGHQFDFGIDRISFREPHPLGPGTYYLVVSGVPGLPHDNSIWVGAPGSAVDVQEMPGFTLGNFFTTSEPGVFPLDGGPDGWRPTGLRFGFVLQGAVVSAPAPEPAAWALMLLGFGAAGAALRARRRVATAA